MGEDLPGSDIEEAIHRAIVFRRAPGRVQRLCCRIGLAVFPAACVVIPAFRRQPCYWRVRLLWGALTREERAACRINVRLNVGSGHSACGHIWLTRDGAAIGEKPPRVRSRLELVGSSGSVDYWVESSVCNVAFEVKKAS
jgi:hypothetical protein